MVKTRLEAKKLCLNSGSDPMSRMTSWTEIHISSTAPGMQGARFSIDERRSVETRD